MNSANTLQVQTSNHVATCKQVKLVTVHKHKFQIICLKESIDLLFWSLYRNKKLEKSEAPTRHTHTCANKYNKIQFQ